MEDWERRSRANPAVPTLLRAMVLQWMRDDSRSPGVAGITLSLPAADR